MKICLISFDYWEYDRQIVKALKTQGIQATHINLSQFKYRYPSFFHRLTNFFQKIFLGKNTKKIKRQQHILETLKSIGFQDKILVINPEIIDLNNHLKIKKYTNEYIAYLYDSVERHPASHLFKNVFDKIYSFDKNDVEKYGLNFITNYIYLPKKEIKSETENKVFVVSSIDERLPLLHKLATYFEENNISFKFILSGKHKPSDINDKIIYTPGKLNLQDIDDELGKTEIILDLVRNNQNGLSFRVFESLAHQKKLITTNQSITEYDFYNPNNILVINSDNPIIDKAFVDAVYIPIDEKTYNKYTLENWTKTVFKLDKKIN